jgi:hypothetical protein
MEIEIYEYCEHCKIKEHTLGNGCKKDIEKPEIIETEEE